MTHFPHNRIRAYAPVRRLDPPAAEATERRSPPFEPLPPRRRRQRDWFLLACAWVVFGFDVALARSIEQWTPTAAVGVVYVTAVAVGIFAAWLLNG